MSEREEEWSILSEDISCLYDQVKDDLVARVKNALIPVVSNGLILIETKFIYNGINWEEGVVNYQLEVMVVGQTITTNHVMVIDSRVVARYNIKKSAIAAIIDSNYSGE